MPAIMKINKGTAEKLIQWEELKPEQSKNISDSELTVEIENSGLVIEPHKIDGRRWLEISDLDGSFGVWVELTHDNVSKLKSVLDF